MCNDKYRNRLLYWAIASMQPWMRCSSFNTTSPPPFNVPLSVYFILAITAHSFHSLGVPDGFKWYFSILAKPIKQAPWLPPCKMNWVTSHFPTCLLLEAPMPGDPWLRSSPPAWLVVEFDCRSRMSMMHWCLTITQLYPTGRRFYTVRHPLRDLICGTINLIHLSAHETAYRFK